MEQCDDQSMRITDIQDDDPFHPKAASLPSEHQFHLDEGGSSRRSTTSSDEETDVGFINKTRSFPDLTKSTHAQQQQALAIKEAKLRNWEEAIQQKERHLKRQNEAMIRGYPQMYGEQPLYTGTGGGYNWTGAMAYTGQPSTQAPTAAATFIYHPSEHQWSRPHGMVIMLNDTIVIELPLFR